MARFLREEAPAQAKCVRERLVCHHLRAHTRIIVIVVTNILLVTDRENEMNIGGGRRQNGALVLARRGVAEAKRVSERLLCHCQALVHHLCAHRLVKEKLR